MCGQGKPPGEELQVPAGGRGPHRGDAQGGGGVRGALVGGLLRRLPPVTDEDPETQRLSKLPQGAHSINSRAGFWILHLFGLSKPLRALFMVIGDFRLCFGLSSLS